jgi:hypothetical protein
LPKAIGVALLEGGLGGGGAPHAAASTKHKNVAGTQR